MLELLDAQLVYNANTPTEVTALRQITLTLPTATFATVVGSNGAGKSSLVQIVSGAVSPTRGRVRIGGVDVTRQPAYRRAGRVGRVFDNPHAGTVPELSIEENMALAMSRGHRRGVGRAVTRARRGRMTEGLAELGLGLERRLSDPVCLLSAGQRQSLTMVMAALTRPEVLLLDEHLAALDPGTQAKVLKLTVDLVRQLGCTSLMITHNMQHAIDTGDRLLVMSRGRLIADFEGPAKATLTIADLVTRITGQGDTVSDRLLLEANV